MPTLHEEYLRVLEPWAGAAGRDMYVPPERPDLWCYGSGFNGWGVQTNQKAFAALAVLATEPELDEARAGLSRAELLARALGLLRFSLASHLSGEFTCLDGTTWGHTWISALGIERMLHAVQALEPHLTPADQAALRRVLLSECDWLVDGYFRNAGDPPGSIQAGLIEHNHPENNLWNGVLLQRVAWMYPDAPRHADYLRQGLAFLLNGISVPADAESAERFAGQPLSAWHVGANFFPSYGLNHHRYLNVGYMVICLSQIAMAHFAWKARGQSAPAAVYHHAEDLWRVVKLLTFPDGRLARVGGDTRARYCYCQDYAIPVWLLMLDRAADPDAPGFERRWLAILRREVAAGDGAAFLSARLAPMARISPTYYTRLESDRAAALSMALYWRRLSPALPEAPAPAEPAAAGG
ncbi:MAG: hypothetical protein K9N49_08545, partial [Candidatus Marinimicrobia bacterium]|nr:hypothetical protein [Candidatus Neomarinimicrobiota bacterium]